MRDFIVGSPTGSGCPRPPGRYTRCPSRAPAFPPAHPVGRRRRGGVQARMPVYIDKEKQRWRFTFNRVIKGERHRATKLLPAAWGRAKAEAYDRTETARLYAVATGVERPEPLIERAVELYLDHRLPKLRKTASAPASPRSSRTSPATSRAGRCPSSPTCAASTPRRTRPRAGDDQEPPRLPARRLPLRLAQAQAHRRTTRPGRWNSRWSTTRATCACRSRTTSADPAAHRRHETRALFTLAFYTGSRWESEILPRQPEDVHR
jgi:hypothetical protein